MLTKILHAGHAAWVTVDVVAWEEGAVAWVVDVIAWAVDAQLWMKKRSQLWCVTLARSEIKLEVSN